MGKRPKDIKSIFSEAIEKKTAEERAAYLDRVCGDDAALRTEFESLLRAYDEAGDFLETPVFDADMPLDDSPVSEAPGTVIGRYKLLEKIGEGGMAVVYMAQQEKPIRHKVAFKIIKWGMDTKNVIARFEAERQVLALMEHPNIAKILDAGSTQTGRPYFVMELVTGISITKYCDKNNLSTKERLELFIQVCHAVQHAHQKGIIHRDIKPSNVMITYHDDKPIPKVIDFGIAKATNQRLTEKTLFTRYAHMIGTPAYMSPEQAQMSDLDIDTRSDIYSLGVLLYELLTGTTPFSEEELRKAGYLEMQRIIAKQEPTKPSTKLNSLGDTLTKIATHHRSTPDLLRKSVRGDLDWIVMKCLEKDRAGRYDTATELAADINRHLGHEPVRAAAPSLLYKSRKFVRRHRMSVLVGLLVSVFILIFLCALSVSTVLIWREQGRTQQALEREQKALNKEIQARTEAERQTKIAQASLDREQKALSQEIQARTEAERQTKIAQAVADFLNNGLLASVDPARARGRQVTVREILDAASQKIEGKFKDEPLIEASVRLTLGNTYMELGEYTEAARQLELAHKMHEEYLPQDHLMALQSMKALSWLYIKQGRYSEAESMLLAVREIGWRVLGEAHPITLGCMNNLGVLYKNQGRYEEAEALYLRTIEIQQRVSGEDNLGTLNTMNNLALLYSDLGRYQEAEVLYKRTLEIKTQRFGEDHPDTLRTMSNLANLVKEQGRYEEAEVLYLKTFEIRIHVLGEEHPDTLGSMNNLAILYFRRGQYKEAEQLYVKTLIIEQRVLGEEHPSTLNCLHNLALLYKEQQRYEESEPLLLKTMETRQRILGKDHPDTVKALNLLIDLYEAWGKSDEVQKWRANLSEVKAEQSTIQVPKYMVPEENYKIPKELYPCVGNLKKIYLAIDKYHKENGTWPDWLSDLIPNYLDKDTLLCFGDTEHTSKYSPDPKLPCSYSWELSLAPVLKDLDPNGGTSYLDLKIQQTKLFGDVVPMIRCYHHGDNRALNISMGGQVYLSPLNWEDIFKKDHNFKEDPNLPLIGASFPEPKLLVASALGASWSPDGTCLVFCKWLGHRDGLQVLDIETGEMTDLTSSGKDPAWSPDGRFIAYVEGRGALEETWIVMSSGGTPRKIIDGGYPSWSVNGKTLYVHSRRDRKILAVTIDKPDAESEAFFDCPQSWYPAISPDSERVAFGRRDELVIANCQSKQIVLIWPTPGHRGLLCDWSPDSKKVAFAGFNDEPLGVWILDVESQEAVQVADESYNSPDWSPDGTKLAFERHADNVREIWMVETEKIRGPKVNAAQAAKLSKLILGSRVSQPATPVARPPENPLIGKIAPGFTLKDLNGQQISLSDFRGKVMLLDFWATWCGPCVKSIPNLEKLYTRYKDEGLVVLGLNDELDHAKVEQFAQGKISYTVLLDAKSQFAEYDIRAIPTLFYVDRQGMIRYKERGFREGRENEIEDKIKELLALEQITIQPIDPGVYRLIASYSMENNARDGSGDAYDGTLYGDPNFVEGVDGMAIALDGVDDYIELPIGKLIAEMSECTISIWVKWSGKGRFWQRIFDFGNSSDIYMLLTANNDKSGRPRFAITLTSYKTEDQTTSSYVLDFRWHHLAVTIDPGNTAHSLYIDGQLVDRNTAARYVPRSLGQTIHNWLGKSQFSDDPYFEGSLDEFRIYDRVLSTGEILYLAGHRKEVIPEEND